MRSMRPGFQTSLAIRTAGFYKEKTEILRFAQNDSLQEAETTSLKLRNVPMKRFFRIFELSANEQRVVLIIMLILITIAVITYERRIHHASVESASAPQPKPSATVVQTVGDQ